MMIRRCTQRVLQHCHFLVLSIPLSIAGGAEANVPFVALLACAGADQPAPSVDPVKTASNEGVVTASDADESCLMNDDLDASALDRLDCGLRDAFELVTREGWPQEAAAWWFFATTDPGSRSPRLLEVLVSTGFCDRVHEAPPLWALQRILWAIHSSRHSTPRAEASDCENTRLAVPYGGGKARGLPSRAELVVRREALSRALTSWSVRHLLLSWVVNDTGFFRQLGIIGLVELGGFLPGEVDELLPLISVDSELRYLVAVHIIDLVPASRRPRIVELFADQDDDCAQRAAAIGLVSSNSAGAAASLALERFDALRSPRTIEDLLLASRLRLASGESASALDALFDRLVVADPSDDQWWLAKELPALVLDWAMLAGEEHRSRLDRVVALAMRLSAASRDDACAWFSLAGCLIDPSHESLRALALSSLTYARYEPARGSIGATDPYDMRMFPCVWHMACAVSAVPDLAGELYTAARSGLVSRGHPVWSVLRLLVELDAQSPIDQLPQTIPENIKVR